MLIVEGADLVGKTTFCKALVAKLNEYDELGRGYDYGWLTRLPPGWNYYHSYVDRMVRRRVQDRFHDSELAYSFARGEPHSLLTHDLYRLVEAKLALIGAVKVVVICNEYLLHERFEKHGDDMYGFDVIRKANQWFHENQWRFDVVIECNFSNPWPTFVGNPLLDTYIKRQCQLSLTIASRKWADGSL